MRMPFTRAFAALILLTVGVTAAVSQESPLGSSAQVAGRYTTNYADAVRAALPKADTTLLNTTLAGVAAAAAKERPLAILDQRVLQQTFALVPGEGDGSGFIDTGEAVYKVDPTRQRVFMARRSAAQPVLRKEFQTEFAAIRSAHQDLAAQLGITREQLLFTDTREVLSETDGHPELEKGVKGEIMAEGAVTTMLRAVNGVLVEGSFLRMSSIDAKHLEFLDARWPQVRLSGAALRAGLRGPQDVASGIVKRVAADSNNQAVNVRMAVVLRPVTNGATIEFVPSLKVGVQPQSIKTEDGFRTDAGEIFFVDLVKGAPPIADIPDADTGSDDGVPAKGLAVAR